MEFVFRDLVTKCWWSWGAFIVAFVAAVTLAANGNISDAQQAWIAIVAYAALVIFFAYPLLQAACAGHRHLLTVCIWSFVLVLLGVALCYYVFYKFAGNDVASFDKLLNVVPVLVAIWAAALGWFVHFRLSTKAHRTNNAFGILMEMRKSSEFLNRYETATRHFPSGTTTIPPEYTDYFPTTKLKEVLDVATARGEAAAPSDLEKIEAISALRYVLNYFEFMSVGIQAGDLDEDLLYDTISTTVVKLYERSQPLFNYVHAPMPGGAGQPLAFVALESLAERWRVRLNNDLAKQANNGARR